MEPFRPAAYQPSFHRLVHTVAPTPVSPVMGQTFDQLLDWSPALGDVVRLAFHGMTSYLGIHVGLKEKGFLSYFGWFMGIGQGIGALCDVISLGKRVIGTHPPETKTGP